MSDQQRYYRKIIHVAGTDSPNVKLGLEQVRRGLTPTNAIIIPGVLPYFEYLKRLQTWDEIRIHIGIHGLFYDGAETRLYPGEWIDLAKRHAKYHVEKGIVRRSRSIGIDCGEGVSDTTMIATDEYGIVEGKSKKTPNTAVIVDDAVAFIRRHYTVPHDRVVFDAGGGGKQAADYIRAHHGISVRTVRFNDAPTLPIKRSRTGTPDRIDNQEDRAAYSNLRSQMYYELRERLDPILQARMGFPAFGIPEQYTELVRQMTPLPLWYDEKERVYLPPKQLRTDQRKGRLDDTAQDKVTINKLLGCSPDWVDALVLAVHGMLHKSNKIIAGALK